MAATRGPRDPLDQKNCAGKGVRCWDRRGTQTIIDPASFRRLEKGSSCICNTASNKLVNCQIKLNYM